MPTYNNIPSPFIHARIAGVLYLIIIVSGIFSEVFVRAKLIVEGDAATTAANILSSTGLFRMGFASDTIMLLSDVAIAIIFYVLLKPVNKTLSLTAAAFRMIQAAIVGASLLCYYAALMVLTNAGDAVTFEADQINALAMFFLEIHRHGYDLGLIFFGVSSLILGYLVIRSLHFPSTLGYGLMAAAVVYIMGSVTLFLAPEYMPFIEPVYIVPFIAELSFCLWLLVKGIKEPA